MSKLGQMHATQGIGDMDLFVDTDGSAYHVRTSFTIVKLSTDYLTASSPVAEVKPPKSSEAPVLFKVSSYHVYTVA